MLKTGGILFAGAAALAMLAPVEASAQQTRQSNTLQCAGTVSHFTERGFAFECIDSRGTSSDIVVVTEGSFPGRVGFVVDTLREAKQRGSGAGRTRGTQGLSIRHRPANPAAQAICAQVERRFPAGACVVAVDIAYR